MPFQKKQIPHFFCVLESFSIMATASLRTKTASPLGRSTARAAPSPSAPDPTPAAAQWQYPPPPPPLALRVAELDRTKPYAEIDSVHATEAHASEPYETVVYRAHSHREALAAQVALSGLAGILQRIDASRVQDIIQANIAAAMPLQIGARAQAQLVGEKIQQALSQIPMLTALEVGEQSGSQAAKPEGLAAQWASRRQIFGVEMVGYGLRFPSFQFQQSGRPWPWLAKVLPSLSKALAPLDLLLWFDTPHPALNSQSSRSPQSPRQNLHDLEALQRAVHETLTPVEYY